MQTTPSFGHSTRYTTRGDNNNEAENKDNNKTLVIMLYSYHKRHV